MYTHVAGLHQYIIYFLSKSCCFSSISTRPSRLSITAIYRLVDSFLFISALVKIIISERMPRKFINFIGNLTRDPQDVLRCVKVTREYCVNKLTALP